ncbi:MAG: hypothetical protein ACYCSO_07050 [Cuniculiplasma sp.]
MPFIETEWVSEPLNELIRRLNEEINFDLYFPDREALEIPNRDYTENSRVELIIGLFLKTPRETSPFSGFRNSLRRIDSDLWNKIPQDLSERVDECLNQNET